jgi:hypothetical protein
MPVGVNRGMILRFALLPGQLVALHKQCWGWFLGCGALLPARQSPQQRFDLIQDSGVQVGPREQYFYDHCMQQLRCVGVRRHLDRHRPGEEAPPGWGGGCLLVLTGDGNLTMNVPVNPRLQAE